MTNNTPNQPNGPGTDRSAQQTPRGVYNPITLDDLLTSLERSGSVKWPRVDVRGQPKREERV